MRDIIKGDHKGRPYEFYFDLFAEKERGDPDHTIIMIKDNIFNAISVLWDVTLQGIGAWLITAPIIALILFAVIHPVFIKMESNLKKQNGN